MPPFRVMVMRSLETFEQETAKGVKEMSMSLFWGLVEMWVLWLVSLVMLLRRRERVFWMGVMCVLEVAMVGVLVGVAVGWLK